MTIGIAVPFPGGSILCADSRLEAADGSAAGESTALMSVTSGKRMFAITWVAKDARAGKMLASEIATVACGAASHKDVIPGIKRVMGDWFRSYGVAPAPPVQFLIASNASDESSGRVLLCEPPSTVVDATGPCVIGTGARPVSPMLQLVAPRFHQALSLRSTVLRMTYLMHLARKYEGQSVGEDTEMIVLSNRGSFTYIDRRELKTAEGLGEKIDLLLFDVCRQLLCADSEQSPQSIAEEFLRGYFDVMEQNSHVYFPSLSFLEKASAQPSISSLAPSSLQTASSG